MEEPDDDRAESAEEEEVVHGGVVAEGAEDSAGAHEAPDDGGVEKDSVAGTGPWAVYG